MMSRFKRIISWILTFVMILSMTTYSSGATNTGLSDPNPQILSENIEVENIEVENIETETILTECITSEIYLEELVVAESMISEFLLEEETINEVLLCETIYVPQDNLEEFAKHSQMSELFGNEADVGTVLKKIAVGTGVIVTLAVVKKAGLPDPIASVIFAAADKALQFGEGGAVIGSLFGGLTGASDEIDSSGRTSAVLGFALATAGLILSAVSLVGEIPSAGSTSISLAAGIKLIIAGVSVVAATGTTAYAGYNAVKTFTSTDSSEIDWDNIDWEQVGVVSAQKAIQNGADGYMWGSIVGAVYGGTEGYEYYHKYNTPYTKYEDRIKHVKRIKKGIGEWTGEIGESDFVLKDPIVLSDGTKITKVTYRNGIPDFSPYAIAEVKIPNMTNERQSTISKGIIGNFDKADTALAEYWTKIKYNGRIKWTGDDVKIFRESYPYKLTWHEMSNMESMQLVPLEVNATFKHYGGVAEYSVMIGQNGGADFD